MERELETKAPIAAAWSAVTRYEILFSICMGVVAILSRENPMLKYPEILWFFAAFFIFNLTYSMLSKIGIRNWHWPMASIAVNDGVISGILSASGGAGSYFWPMYLLPIFTACLYLKKRHVAFAVAISAGFLSYYYIEPIWYGSQWHGTELLIKLGVLALSAGITYQVASKERAARSAMEKSRAEYASLARTLDSIPRQASNHETLGSLVDCILHDFNNPLTVILGSIEILLREAGPNSPQREDLERIRKAARFCGNLTRSLLLCHDPESESKSDLQDIVHQLLVLLDYRVKSKHLTFTGELPKDLPAVRLNSAQLRQTLLNVLINASDAASAGTPLRIHGTANDDGIDLRLVCQTSGAHPPFQDVVARNNSILGEHGSFDVCLSESALEYKIHLEAVS